MTDTEFDWPWQYNFPPFFTLQPNLVTRQKQLEAWSTLILQFCKFNKIYLLDVTEIQNNSLFYNKSIGRKANQELIRVIIDEMVGDGNSEWVDKQQKNRFYVYWRNPEEWGQLIYRWANNNGMTNTVCTLFELTQGDDTAGEDFYGLDSAILKKALVTLEKDGKAELISDDGAEGVKFF